MLLLLFSEYEFTFHTCFFNKTAKLNEQHYGRSLKHLSAVGN